MRLVSENKLLWNHDVSVTFIDTTIPSSIATYLLANIRTSIDVYDPAFNSPNFLAGSFMKKFSKFSKPKAVIKSGLLVVGPPMEEKYGSKPLLCGMVFTALVTGVLQCVLFPRSGLLGASGIVFMLIMLSSLAGFSGGIPVTMLLVAALYFGQQVYDIIFVHDNVANFMHIVGGLCGTAFGYYSALHSRRRPAKAVKFSSTNSRRKR